MHLFGSLLGETVNFVNRSCRLAFTAKKPLESVLDPALLASNIIFRSGATRSTGAGTWPKSHSLSSRLIWTPLLFVSVLSLSRNKDDIYNDKAHETNDEEQSMGRFRAST
jgi:hypothetical protein